MISCIPYSTTFFTPSNLDAFKAALGNQSGGMDEFMKFMMIMSMMGGGRGGGFGGGGYGGSQYGYGGVNPGGVQSAYNPWQNIQSAVDELVELQEVITKLSASQLNANVKL